MPEPVSTTAAILTFGGSYLAGKALDKVGDAFYSRVLGPWRRRRAEQFFDQLCREIGTTGAESFDEYLDDLLQDESNVEILGDAYRSVCFAKSKVLGPRIIAYLTVQSLREGERYDDDFCEAAEVLNDEELRECATFWEYMSKRADAFSDDERRHTYSDTFTTTDSGAIVWTFVLDELTATPVAWSETVGRWANRGTFGFVEQELTLTSELEFGCSNPPDGIQRTSITTHRIDLFPRYKQFVEIVKRVDVVSNEVT